jgi:GntR family transcriptional regulator/MocR family aminotransferase
LVTPRSAHRKAAPSSATRFWVKGPGGLDGERLGQTALEHGLIIEPGRINFMGQEAPTNYFRLGFSSIPTERIEPGIELLANLIDRQMS